jgi:hypothetical protein
MAPVVLITGCTEGGIGYELARYLHRHGCRVFATARRPGAAPGLEDLGIPVLQLDVVQQESCADAVEEVVRAAGRLDVLVNNAGASVVVRVSVRVLLFKKKSLCSRWRVLGRLPLCLKQQKRGWLTVRSGRSSETSPTRFGPPCAQASSPWARRVRCRWTWCTRPSTPTCLGSCR